MALSTISERIMHRIERCLFVCPFSPAPNAVKAGHRLAFEYIAGLSARQPVDVILILDVSEQLAPELASLANVSVVAVVRVSRLQKIKAIASNMWRYSPRFSTRLTPTAWAAVDTRLRNHQYSVFRSEFSQAFPFVELAWRANVPKRVLSVHDIQSQLVATKSWLERSLLRLYTMRSERKLLAWANEVLVLSEKDERSVRELCAYSGPLAVQAVPLGGFVKRVRRSERTVQNGAILFWGAMGRIENERAVLHFVDQIFPPLLKRHPYLHLYVVGSAPSERMLRRAGRSVTVTGFVHDPSEYFEKAHWGVVPLMEGAGIKLKTLEMLACGLPVLSTELGAEGIAPQNDLHVVALEEFGAFLDRQFTSGI